MLEDYSLKNYSFGFGLMMSFLDCEYGLGEFFPQLHVPDKIKTISMNRICLLHSVNNQNVVQNE